MTNRRKRGRTRRQKEEEITIEEKKIISHFNNRQFSEVHKKFENNHEDYELEKAIEIYLPFWEIKQNIIIEKEKELDKFSRIILELIHNGISTHDELCLFLGVDTDSFVTMQFHFLIKIDLIKETITKNKVKYQITQLGQEFVKNKRKKRTETEIIEVNYLLNDLTDEFFDEKLPIDKKVSKGKKANFSSYKVMQSHKIDIPKTAKEIKHNSTAINFEGIRQKRSTFTNFYNKKFKDDIFYDFADEKVKSHKRNICFLCLAFVHSENKDDKILEIRHSKKSVEKFNGYVLEESLTQKIKEYLQKNPNFI